MSRRILACLGIVSIAGLITWSVSAQQYQAPYPQGGVAELFAANLGIYYRIVPYSASGGGFNPATGNYDPSNPPSSGYPAPYPGSFS